MTNSASSSVRSVFDLLHLPLDETAAQLTDCVKPHEATLLVPEPLPQLSCPQVREDLDRVLAAILDVEGRRYLLRTELQGQAYAALACPVTVRPPTRLQLLN